MVSTRSPIEAGGNLPRPSTHTESWVRVAIAEAPPAGTTPAPLSRAVPPPRRAPCTVAKTPLPDPRPPRPGSRPRPSPLRGPAPSRLWSPRNLGSDAREPLISDPGHVQEIVNRLERAVLFPVIDDPLPERRPDSRQRLE